VEADAAVPPRINNLCSNGSEPDRRAASIPRRFSLASQGSAIGSPTAHTSSRERCKSAILSSCHPIWHTALALYAPWCSCTRSIFAASSTPGGWP